MSQISGFFLSPPNILLLLLCIGTALLFSRWHRIGVKLTALVAVSLLCLATLPVGTWLLTPLENRFSVPAKLPDRISGIIVLGGAFDHDLILSRKQLILQDPGERLFAFLHLARLFPEARLVFAGGQGSLGSEALNEILPAHEVFTAMGLRADRVILEPNAINTRENSVYTHDLIKPGKKQPWILITSAWHMPRSVGTFQAAGWSVIPYPVDYRTGGDLVLQPGFNLLNGLKLFTLGVREWTALIYYRLRGWC